MILCIFHPDTTDPGNPAAQMLWLLSALEETGEDVLLLWPNIDAGSDAVSKAIRTFRTAQPRPWLTVRTNLDPNTFYRLLQEAKCCVGNSSSFVRDCGYFGTPVVLVGRRQRGREHGKNVMQVDAGHPAIDSALRCKLSIGRLAPDKTYGGGGVSKRIAEALGKL